MHIRTLSYTIQDNNEKKMIEGTGAVLENIHLTDYYFKNDNLIMPFFCMCDMGI